jgi:hypothetical protein
VPNKDGRAGMAALTLKEGFTVPGTSGGTPFDVAGLAGHCITNLPFYAVPVFLRFLPEYVGGASAVGCSGLAR